MYTLIRAIHPARSCFNGGNATQVGSIERTGAPAEYSTWVRMEPTVAVTLGLCRLQVNGHASRYQQARSDLNKKQSMAWPFLSLAARLHGTTRVKQSRSSQLLLRR